MASEVFLDFKLYLRHINYLFIEDEFIEKVSQVLFNT